MYNKSNNPVFDGIVTFAAVFGGLYLSAEILKLFAKKRTFYACANCGTEVAKGKPECPTCKNHLAWKPSQLLAAN